MRKHARPTALLAVPLLAAAFSAADLMTTTAPAGAHGARHAPASSARASRPRRAPAPATAENLERLRACESEGDYTESSGSRYFGAYQFSVSTWRSLGYEGLPHQAPPQVQDEAAQRLHARSGWNQWPACSRKLGLR
ncbi:MAG: transglycosylase family protein [Actinomycetota bacterium]|jgi:hypothetical protein|nr:transglycosylase family protein [Actinomycetota bacterium]